MNPKVRHFHFLWFTLEFKRKPLKWPALNMKELAETQPLDRAIGATIHSVIVQDALKELDDIRKRNAKDS